jgi:pimeloyl-ACP methyl ester carboxylesterase
MQLNVRGIPLHYEESGEGRPVVLFSGWALDARFMAAHYEPIFERRHGWRRIYPDMPGTGQTPGAESIASQDDMLAVALDFLDAVAPGELPALVGASWGAYIALGIAYRRAARLSGLLLAVPVVHGDRSQRDLPAHKVLASDPKLVATLAPDETQWAEIAVVQSRASLTSFRETIKPALACADLPFLERVAERPGFSFAADRLPEPLFAPALILAGRQDSACGYRDAWPLLEGMPRATYVVLDRAGHDLEDVQATLFEALTAEWLDRVEEYSGRSSPRVASGDRLSEVVGP